MARRRISLSLAAVIIFFAVLLTLVSIRFTAIGKSFPNPVGNLMQQILAPLQSGVMSVTTGIQDDFAVLTNLGKTKQENNQLKAKVAELTRENIELQQKVLAGLRYQELEKKFNAPEIWNMQTVGATIVDRDPSNWYYTITINRGSADGVVVNDCVITNAGLVGKVIAVTNHTADVVLILDSEGEVSGMVRQSDGSPVYGVLQSNYRHGPIGSQATLEMSVPKADNVKPGELVLTSGKGGVFPKDIPIGTVQNVVLQKGGLLKTATITPLVKFDRLEEVFVVHSGGR